MTNHAMLGLTLNVTPEIPLNISHLHLLHTTIPLGEHLPSPKFLSEYPPVSSLLLFSLSPRSGSHSQSNQSLYPSLHLRLLSIPPRSDSLKSQVLTLLYVDVSLASIKALVMWHESDKEKEIREALKTTDTLLPPAWQSR